MRQNLLTQKLHNLCSKTLLLSKTSIGGQIENHGRIKKILKKTGQNNLKVSLFLLRLHSKTIDETC